MKTGKFIYIDLDGMLLRGPAPATGMPPIMTEFLVQGGWIPVKGDQAARALHDGSVVEEAEAREIAGDEWPAAA